MADTTIQPSSNSGPIDGSTFGVLRTPRSTTIETSTREQVDDEGQERYNSVPTSPQPTPSLSLPSLSYDQRLKEGPPVRDRESGRKSSFQVNSGRQVYSSLPPFVGGVLRSEVDGINQSLESLSSTSSPSLPSLSYDQGSTEEVLVRDRLSGSCDSILVDSGVEVYSSLPSFSLRSFDLINIPKKVKRVLERYISVADLRSIHQDPETARELTLIVLSNLSDSFWLDSRFKRLSSEILHRQTSTSTEYVYRRILDLLLKGSEKKGPIILSGENYSKGTASREYGLSDVYYGKGVEQYRLTTRKARDLRNREYFRLWCNATDNTICRNLIHIYGDLTIPTREEIIEEATKLVQSGFTTKKGKTLTFLHKHSKSRWKDAESRSFVEENIELFDLLTDNGFAIPVVGDEHSGGRVVDSFTLMPSWIRAMITVDGERLAEADFSALHPNLVRTIYGGSMSSITHQQVCDATGMSKQQVKTEHLSMFNRRIEDMVKSPVYDYYRTRDFEMVDRIIGDKLQNGYRSTSRRMFSLETELMTRIISKLNREGIYVLYVYDALMCHPKHHRRMVDVMNETACEMNIHTTAK